MLNLQGAEASLQVQVLVLVFVVVVQETATHWVRTLPLLAIVYMLFRSRTFPIYAYSFILIIHTLFPFFLNSFSFFFDFQQLYLLFIFFNEDVEVNELEDLRAD